MWSETEFLFYFINIWLATSQQVLGDFDARLTMLRAFARHASVWADVGLASALACGDAGEVSLTLQYALVML